MKIVPLKRLLIQPTVQLKWIEQHQEIEFELSFEIQQNFEEIWSLYLLTGRNSMRHFLQSDSVLDFNLVEDDHLFALLVGADFIRAKHQNFRFLTNKPNLHWLIS